MSRWVVLARLADLPAGSKKLVAVEVGPADATSATRLLVVHHTDGSVHVVDGRCPHEGYPLSDAAVDDGCVLTCAWHNWKFDLRTGDSTLGGEGVHRWPSRVVDGAVEVDAQGPDPAADREARLASLTVALEQGRMGRGLRDSLRLLVAGVSAAEICAHIARHDALYAQWGTTHALPVAADCARLASEISDPYAALHCIAPALDMCIDGNQRLPMREGASPGQIARAVDTLADGGRALLAAAIETEDAAEAEALVRGAHIRGVAASEVESWVLHAIAAHFTDFGHSLIYLQKLRELRVELGEGADPLLLVDLLVGLVVSLAYGTREDTLPYMRRWFGGPLLGGRDFAVGDLRDALVSGERGAVLAVLGGALAGGTPVRGLTSELIVAGAHRLEWFDEVVGEDHAVDEGWLSASHRFTAAVAIAELIDHVPCSEHDVAALLRQGCAFVSLGRATDRGEAPKRVGVPSDWRESALAEVLDDRFVRPIRLAHGIKTLVAVADVQERLGDLSDEPVHALLRFFATAGRQRRMRSQVHDAIRWLRDGKPPKRLTR